MLNDCVLFIDDLWRDLAGLPERREERSYPLELLKATQWCSEFEEHMRAALIMGARRYGPIKGAIKGAPEKRRFDRVTAILARTEEYRETGNLALLVDVANFALLEYVEGEHPSRHFNSESGAQAGKVKER